MGMFDDILDNVGKPFNQSKGFEYGTHEVLIGDAVAEKDSKGREVIKITVFDELDNEKQATCTLWFHSEGGAKMAVAKVLGLLVHNVGEEKKDAVRELGKKLFGSITTPEDSRAVAVKLIQDKLIGKKAYLVSEPQGKYATTSYGDIWHYPAEPQGERKPTVDNSKAPDISPDEIPNFEEV